MRSSAALILITTVGAMTSSGCRCDTVPAPVDPVAVHRDSLVIDTHIDAPYRISKHGVDVSERLEDGHFDFVRAREGGLDGIFFAIFVPSTFNKPGTHPEAKGGALAEAQALLRLVGGVLEKNVAVAEHARTPDDLRRIVAAGKRAILLGLENGSPIEGELAKLRQLREAGIIYITLTHSRDNQLADSSYDDRHTHGGLSAFGKRVVRQMNRLGIIVDVSHLSDEAFWDVLEISSAPVIASHSGLRAFRNWERNVSDEMVRAMAEKGGVLQLNFGSYFLRDDVAAAIDRRDEMIEELEKKGGEELEERIAEVRRQFDAQNATLDDVVGQIDHVVKMVGVDHIGLGSDYDGVRDTPKGLEDVSTYPALTAALLARGYSVEDVRKINGGNFMRVWEQVRSGRVAP